MRWYTLVAYDSYAEQVSEDAKSIRTIRNGRVINTEFINGQSAHMLLAEAKSYTESLIEYGKSTAHVMKMQS